MINDSDETEGRQLYRARADALALAQIAMAKRQVKLMENLAEIESLPPGSDREPEYLRQRREHPDE